MIEIEHNGTNEIVCPYCGDEWSDSWEIKDGGVCTCYKCNKKFNVTVNYSVDYSTSKISCNEGKHDYVFDCVHLSYQNYKNGSFRMIPEDQWTFIEIMKCTLCDDKTYNNVLPREEWISKYPDDWKKYQEWIIKDRAKEDFNEISG